MGIVNCVKNWESQSGNDRLTEPKPKTQLTGHFFPSNAFLRRRRKKALLRVNDRGGDWRMCILALCRVSVSVRVFCTCVRAPLSN